LTKAEDRGFDIIHCKEKELIAAQKKKDDIARKRRTAAVASKSAKAVAAAAAAVLASSEAQAIGLGTRSAAPISVSAPLTSISLIKNASSNVLSESSQAAVTSAAFEAYEKSLSSQTAGGNNFSTGGGGGSNSINSGAPSANLQNPTVMSDYLAYKKLVNDYSAAVHFTKEDMLNVGRDVCLALSEMANLPQAYNYVSALSSMESQSAYNNKNTSLTASTAAGNKIRAQEGAGEADTSANEGKYPLSENKDKDKSVNDNVSSPPSENLSNMTSDQWALSRRILERPLPPAKAPTTPFYDHSEMHNPLIHISSFSTDACHYAQRRFATEFDNMGVGWGRVGRTYGSVTNGVAPADVGLPVNKIGANVGLRMKVEIDITKEFGYVLENPNQDRGGRTRRSIFAENSSNDNNGSGVEEQGGDDREDSASPFSTDLNADTVSAASSSGVDGEKTSKTKPRREAQSKKNRGKSKNSSNSSSDNGIASAESARLFDFTDFFSGPSKTTAAADAESEGSDSDPSVDNVPTETMLRKLGKAKVEAGSGPATDVSNILRAAEIKKRRADAKIAKSNNVLEKRRLANLQKAQFIQYQLEKQRYDEAKASHTFSNPTLSAGNSSGNMSGGGSHGNGSKSGHDDSTNPKFSARSRKGSVAGGSGGGSGVSSKEKIVPKGSRLVSHQKKKYISHTPSYKLATDYNDDDASMTPVGEVGNLSLSTHVGSGSYYKDGLNSFVGGAGAGVCRTPVAVQQYPNPLAQSSSASASEFYSGSGYGYAPSSSSTSSQSRAQETNSPLRRWNSLASLDSNNAANNSSASYSNSRCSYSDGHGNGNGNGNGRPTSAESETFSVPDGNETLSAFSSFIKANEGKGRTERHNQNQKQGLDVRLRERGKGRDRGFAGGDSVQGGVEGGGRHVYGEANYSPAERRLQVDLDAAVAAMATAMTTTTSTATSDDGGITLYNEDLMGLGGGTGVGMGMSGADPSSFFVAAVAAAGSPSSSLVTEAAQAGNIGDAIRDRAGVRERERRFQMHLLEQRLKSMNDAAAAEKTTTLQGQGDGSNGTDVKRSRGMIRGVSSRSPNELKAVLPLVSSPARGGGGEESRRSHTHTTRVRSISSSSIDQDFYVAPSFLSSPSVGTGTGTGTEAGRISPSQKLIKKVPTSGAAAVTMARPVAARHMASDFDAAGTWKGNSDSSSF
jgi:hypothetical protein